MTKQEEILKDLDELLINYTFPKLKGISLGKIVLKQLQSEGVVILASDVPIERCSFVEPLIVD